VLVQVKAGPAGFVEALLGLREQGGNWQKSSDNVEASRLDQNRVVLSVVLQYRKSGG